MESREEWVLRALPLDCKRYILREVPLTQMRFLCRSALYCDFRAVGHGGHCCASQCDMPN